MSTNPAIPQLPQETLVQGSYQIGLDSEYLNDNYLTFQVFIPELDTVAIVINSNLFNLFQEKKIYCLL